MAAPVDRIQELVRRPRESLAIELKDWVDPTSAHGIAKIVRACLALRNFNGGFLLIGFDNATGAPNFAKAPPDVATLFHADTIQQAVSKYASEPFEVIVHFPELQGQVFPVLEVPAGARTPVVAKALLQDGSKTLIKMNAVYVRSLASNNVVSTTEATWRDWAALTDICFENREADIGRFIRRHLGPLSTAIAGHTNTSGVAADWKFLDVGFSRFETSLANRGTSRPRIGYWEVGVIVHGTTTSTHSANKTFRDGILAVNPDLSGWPPWVDTRTLDAGAQPYTFDEGWESLVWEPQPTVRWGLVDFWRAEPTGRFYQLRGFPDDLRGNAPTRTNDFEFRLQIVQVAESIAVALRMAEASGFVPDNSELELTFRWRELSGRNLTSWATTQARIPVSTTCQQHEVRRTIKIPGDIPQGRIVEFTKEAVEPLLRAFGGYELDDRVYAELVARLLARQL